MHSAQPLSGRNEVQELVAAGAAVIKTDEPAIRKGLPLRKREQVRYLALGCGLLPALGCRDAR